MCFENALHENAIELINMQNSVVNQQHAYDLKIEGKSLSAKNSG
jgi:hypothetical protein